MTKLITTHAELDALEARWAEARAGLPPLSFATLGARNAYIQTHMTPIENIARDSFEAVAGRPLRGDAHPFSSLRLELDARGGC